MMGYREKSVNQPLMNNTLNQKQSSKYFLPVWVWALLVFLIAIVVMLGGYIAVQKREEEKAATSVMPTGTPSEGSTRTPMVVPTADWKTFTDENAGFTLLYPPNVLFNVDGKEATQSALSVSVEPLESIPEELPLGIGRTAALADRTSLENGIAETKGDFAASDALVRIGGKYNGRMTSVLSRFEVCSVLFTRSLIYYPGTNRVTISLTGVGKDIINSMPEFFTTDPTNCGELPVWNRDVMGTFLPTLAKGQRKGAAQVWYDTFTAIIKTIELTKGAGVMSLSSLASPNASLGGPSSIPASACDVADNAFCNVLSDIKASMASKNYTGLIAYQTTTTVTCNPDGMAIAICEGAPKGAVKEGYSIGYNQSEGTVQTKDQHLVTVSSYVAGNGPFIYKGSLQSGDKGMIVYLNADVTKLFALYMKRAGATWRIDTILIGGTWGDEEFINLKPSLLERVQN